MTKGGIRQDALHLHYCHGAVEPRSTSSFLQHAVLIWPYVPPAAGWDFAGERNEVDSLWLLLELVFLSEHLSRRRLHSTVANIISFTMLYIII